MFKGKYLVMILALALVLVMLGVAPAQAAYNLVWSDEFNGTSLNTNNWVYDTGGGGWGNNELEYYTSGSNISVANGILSIIAKRENMGGYSFTSSRIKTKGKYSFTYGRVEARILTPKGIGLWPAAWMLGANIDSVSWPSCGEIDIMEQRNNDAITLGTMHWQGPSGYAYYGGQTGCSNGAWHVYSIEWTPSYIRWFLDGVQYWEGNIAGGINSTEEFSRPFFILLNLAVGGNFTGYTTVGSITASFPATLQVDYVRVYQDNGQVPTPSPGITPTATKTPTPSSGFSFTQGVENVSSSQARFWFKPTQTCSYVIIHYTVAGQAQQNVNMTYNSSAARWEYTVGGLSAGKVITYSFTYNKDGLQYDTGTYSWTKP